LLQNGILVVRVVYMWRHELGDTLLFLGQHAHKSG
jgi:hypothetical protein